MIKPSSSSYKKNRFWGFLLSSNKSRFVFSFDRPMIMNMHIILIFSFTIWKYIVIVSIATITNLMFSLKLNFYLFPRQIGRSGSDSKNDSFICYARQFHQIINFHRTMMIGFPFYLLFFCGFCIIIYFYKTWCVISKSLLLCCIEPNMWWVA